MFHRSHISLLLKRVVTLIKFIILSSRGSIESREDTVLYTLPVALG